MVKSEEELTLCVTKYLCMAGVNSYGYEYEDEYILPCNFFYFRP